MLVEENKGSVIIIVLLLIVLYSAVLVIWRIGNKKFMILKYVLFCKKIFDMRYLLQVFSFHVRYLPLQIV